MSYCLKTKAIIAKVEAGFETVGDLIGRVKLLDALQTAMNLARDVNAYLDTREPWKAIKIDQADAARSVYTTLRCIDNLKTILAPFLPFSSQRVHEYLGYEGQLFGDLNIQEVVEENSSHLVLMYDGSKAIGKWNPGELPVGQHLQKPKPLYTKLEPEMIEQERQYLGQPRERIADYTE